jgi:hypothetical protein
VIVAVPDAIPVTIPVEAPIVATDVFPLVHESPGVASESVKDEPTHTGELPPVIAAGAALIVTVVVL